MACSAVSTLTLSGVSALQLLPHSRPASSPKSLPLFAPINIRNLTAISNGSSRLFVSAASHKEYNVASLSALALITAMVVPEVAEAVAPGVSPSLKNLLLSVVAGGVVLAVIGVAVAGVSTFDPVKRS